MIQLRNANSLRAQLRALVEFKLGIWHCGDDIRRTRSLCRGFRRKKVFGYMIACCSYYRKDWRDGDIKEAKRFAKELGLAPRHSASLRVELTVSDTMERSLDWM